MRHGQSNPGSPNYCWAKAGYRIERIKRGIRKIRIIYSTYGDVICNDAGYDAEMEKIKELGIYSE